MANQPGNRVLSRTGARELTLEESSRISGGDGEGNFCTIAGDIGNSCTFVTTYQGGYPTDFVRDSE